MMMRTPILIKDNAGQFRSIDELTIFNQQLIQELQLTNRELYQNDLLRILRNRHYHLDKFYDFHDSISSFERIMHEENANYDFGVTYHSLLFQLKDAEEKARTTKISSDVLPLLSTLTYRTAYAMQNPLHEANIQCLQDTVYHINRCVERTSDPETKFLLKKITYGAEAIVGMVLVVAGFISYIAGLCSSEVGVGVGLALLGVGLVAAGLLMHAHGQANLKRVERHQEAEKTYRNISGKAAAFCHLTLFPHVERVKQLQQQQAQAAAASAASAQTSLSPSLTATPTEVHG